MIEAHLFAIEMPYSNTDQCSLLDSSRDHACPKQYFHRRGAKDAEKEFFVWRRDTAKQKGFCSFQTRPLIGARAIKEVRF